MNNPQSYSKLITTIIVAASAICVAVIYAARQISSSLAPPQSDLAALAERVSENVLAKLKNDPLISQQVYAGLENFQQKRQQQQAQARAEQARRAAEQAKNVRAPDPANDHIRGNPEATISLIEYSDFECPFCKRFHETPKRLLKLYGDKLNWVYRHFPLPFHNPGAQKQAEGAECAGELGGSDAFWRFTDTIYARTKAGGRGFPIRGLSPLAKEIGLDTAAFETCLNSGKYQQKVKDHLAEGANAGVTGTPGSILRNNKTGEVVAISGARPVTDFERGIKRLLNSETSEAMPKNTNEKPAS